MFLFNSLDLRHGLSDITHNKGNIFYWHKSPILNLIELNFFNAFPSLKTHALLDIGHYYLNIIFRVHSSPKPHILFYSNGPHTVQLSGEIVRSR